MFAAPLQWRRIKTGALEHINIQSRGPSACALAH